MAKKNKTGRRCGYELFIHTLWAVSLFVLLAIFINDEPNRKKKKKTGESQTEDVYLGSLA